jgi:hypothetical protein
MSRVDGVLTCVEGDMPLSRHLQAVLLERFPVQEQKPAYEAVGRRPGVWFCPGCAVPLGPGLSCRSCGKSLGDLHYQLIELHPHRDEGGDR